MDKPILIKFEVPADIAEQVWWLFDYPLAMIDRNECGPEELRSLDLFQEVADKFKAEIG